MAAIKPADGFENGTSSQSKENFNKIFMPEETIDQPCDVILVVEDFKEFKAHRQLLSQASPFFEKLLNSDMKESKEGIIRLEMFSESAMGTTLEFIYTGNVQILDEDSARELIAIADYLFLQKLKTLAEGVLLDKHELNLSNCISTYHFAQRYQCKELFIKTKKLILANFSAIYEANREDVLSMSSKEIEMWISSDEIDVSAEEDVFNIILAWIDHDKGKRKKYFRELFLQVRLVCASRDFLCSDVVTNDLVKENEGCLDLVEEAVRLIDSRNFDKLSVTPRKSLESPVIITTSALSLTLHNRWQLHDQDILCYFTREDKWCKLDEMPHEYIGRIEFVCWRGKLYTHLEKFPKMSALASYNLYSNCWMTLQYNRKLRKVFLANEDEMYSLVSEGFVRDFMGLMYETERKRDSFIAKYKPESNSWEDMSSFDHVDRRHGFCVVAKDNFIYFIGGRSVVPCKYVTDVDRYDLSENQWDKVADIQQPKYHLSGALASGKIFIAGRIVDESEKISETYQCEVYSEATNEWQFIKSFQVKQEVRPKLLSVDDKLYILSSLVLNRGKSPDTRVECYDPDKNEWNKITDVPVFTRPFSQSVVNAYSGRIFKGFLSAQQLESFECNPKKRPGQEKHKCTIM